MIVKMIKKVRKWNLRNKVINRLRNTKRIERERIERERIEIENIIE